MSGIDVSSLLKRFARLSDLKLGGLYAVAILPVTVLNELGPALLGWAWLTPLATVAALGAAVGQPLFFETAVEHRGAHAHEE